MAHAGVAGLAYAVALALAAVMVGAGAAKLRHRRRTERTFRSQGLVWPGALATAVPLSELALSALLVVVPPWGGVGTLAVVAGFTTFLVRSLRRGERLGCGCFGASRPGPVGAAEVTRNAVLLAAAAFVAAVAERPVVPSPGAVALVGAATGATAAVTGALRRRSDRRGGLAPQGPAPGRPAPPLRGIALEPGTTTVVGFVSPSCAGCDQLRVSLGAIERRGSAVVVVDLADDASSAVFHAYGVRSAPFLVVVDPSGVVSAAGPARSAHDVADLLGSV